MNNKNEILLVLTDKWCDWEASYVCAVTNSYLDYSVKTIAVDKKPKVSMGNISANIDCCIEDDIDFSNVAIVVLTGGLSWGEHDYDDIAKFIKTVVSNNIPVAAICSATTFLCRQGFLNNVKHTGDSLELFQSQKGYSGENLYIPAQVVVDNGFITANETAAVEFAYEIFKLLNIDANETTVWYDNFKNGAIR